ncbi:MAG: NAD+ synthase [Treponema sp.]|jgi:NAD+ synthase (glutamine-hydrolysing)|nr:NAD+ synthase [Treponema sp.]
MRIAIAQINSTIGDFSSNREKIMAFTRRALEKRADLVLFPELVICGYPPMDILDQDRFVELNIRTVRILQRELPPELAVGVGFVNRSPYSGGKALVNSYGILQGGTLAFEQLKTLLPTYDVFDEARNFEPAREWRVFEWKGERVGVAICEDVWRETSVPGTNYISDPVRRLMDVGASILCAPSASPYVAGKLKVRRALAERISLRGNIPLVYLNAVGANDSIIFDGRSFIVVPKKAVQVSAKAFEEDLLIWDSAEQPIRSKVPETIRSKVPETISDAPVVFQKAPDDPFKVGLTREELDVLEDALVMGIREYMAKCGFSRAHLGLSGGIDSALVAYLAFRALGSDKVVCFSMPSRFSSQGSKDDAAELAQNLGVRYVTLSIEQVFTSFLFTLSDVFEQRPFDIAEENLQARIRGALLMAFSNKFGSMLLTTGNKSELAMGYCTLYGDTNGALGPIGDVFKTEVFALCRRINEKAIAATGSAIIPQAIIAKPPSAELRPNQKDQDSLPPYEVLDEILKLYLFKNLSKDEIVARGWNGELAEQVIKTVARAEFKRRQAPPVLKVSPRAFGMGRRMPIARSIYELETMQTSDLAVSRLTDLQTYRLTDLQTYRLQTQT